MRKEADPRQREANKDVRRAMHSLDLLAGRTLVLEAVKDHAPGIERIDASEARS